MPTRLTHREIIQAGPVWAGLSVETSDYADWSKFELNGKSDLAVEARGLARGAA